ncbi:MAG: ABC transporter permease, partial [Paracoccaceae bacterium]
MQSSPEVLPKQQMATFGFNGWTLWALCITGLVMVPILTVATLALFPTENIWPHLLNTTLPRYFRTTVSLMISVGLGAAAVGTVTAWLIARYRFVGAGWLEWALLMPLAIPAYVGAYALVDLLEYAGPVQTALRGVFGWETAGDYWFPEIRSFPAACFVLTFALYPYVYLLARAAFRDQSSASDDVAKSLGRGAVARFWRIGLPLARPAIAAGAAIVMMETVNDFGTVDYFAVQTLTTGIFSVWLQSGNAGGAAQLACVILAVIIVLVSLEKSARRRMKFFNLSTRHRGVEKTQLTGRRGVIAFTLCALPVLIGFVIPTSVLGWHALNHLDEWTNPALIKALLNTLRVATIAALITVFAGVVMVYGVRL